MGSSFQTHVCHEVQDNPLKKMRAGACPTLQQRMHPKPQNLAEPPYFQNPTAKLCRRLCTASSVCIPGCFISWNLRFLFHDSHADSATLHSHPSLSFFWCRLPSRVPAMTTHAQAWDSRKCSQSLGSQTCCVG